MAMPFVLILLLSLRVVIITCITRRSPNAGLMLAQRRRRWANINPTLGQHPVVLPRNTRLFHRVFINPLLAVLCNFIFCQLESGSRYRDPHLKVGSNYSYLFNFRRNICELRCLKAHFISNNYDC